MPRGTGSCRSSQTLGVARMHTVRQAQPRDMQFVRELFSEAIAGSDWLPAAARTQTDFSAVSEGESVLVCCSLEGRLLGFVSVFEPDSFVHHLYVAPSCQRQGVGKALLSSMRTWLPMPWHLKCVTANESALAFYEANGWIEASHAQGPDGPYVLLRKSDA